MCIMNVHCSGLNFRYIAIHLRNKTFGRLCKNVSLSYKRILFFDNLWILSYTYRNISYEFTEKLIQLNL